MEHKRWSMQRVRWTHTAVVYLTAVAVGGDRMGEVAVCVSGTMVEEGGIALALLETMVCVCQEILLTESGQRLHGGRRGGREMEQLESGFLHAQHKNSILLG